MRFPVSLTETAVLSRSRPPFLFASTTPAPCSGMAALGGSRHEAESVSTKSDGRYTVKKSPSPATGTNGHEYVLYHASKLHSTSKFARLVYDLPGEFCCFLRPALCPENYFKKYLQRRRLAGRQTGSIRSIGGKGETHLNPPQKGGEKDGSNPPQVW